MIIQWDFSDLKATFQRSVSFFMSKAKYFISFIVIGGLIALLLSFFVDKKYEATASLLVDESYTQENTIKNTNLAWVESYKEVMTSSVVLSETIKNSELDYTIEELKDQITISTRGNSLVLHVRVLANSAGEAEILTENLLEVFSDKITVLGNVHEVEVLENVKADNKAVEPNYPFNILRGSIYGFIISLIILLLKKNDYQSIKKKWWKNESSNNGWNRIFRKDIS